jgi:selenocysteine-specific elongation factor
LSGAGRLVLGVIGHVDHGKTALVRALTGMETDRLPEERRRGISIALGFAHLAVPGGVIDFIDMPGHERFVRTMVAGATGLDAVLVVVAGNEGIKPQTLEHLDIAALLGVRRAVIAVSKADLVSAGEVQARLGEAAALVGRLGLEVAGAAAVSAVSGASGAGVAALAELLAEMVRDAAPRADDGFAYLPADRAFSVAGHGTVVTGTLRRGRLAASDELALLPSGRKVRVRGLQVHGARVTAAEPGQRVAVNLRDVAVDEVGRGVALTAPGMLPPCGWLSVELRVVAGAPALQDGARLMLLFGTEEVPVRLRLLEGDEAGPGDVVMAQFQAARPVSVPARERFIVRRPSPPVTLGGGRVIDPGAVRLRRRDPAALARLRALTGAGPAEIVRIGIEAAGDAGVMPARLAQMAGVAPARAVALAQTLPVVTGRQGLMVTRTAFERVSAAVLAACAGTEDALGPVALAEGVGLALGWRAAAAVVVPEGGMARHRPGNGGSGNGRAGNGWAGKGRSGNGRAGSAVIEEAVERLVQAGRLVRAGGAVGLRRAAREQGRVQQEQAAAGALAEAVRQGGLSPPEPGMVAPGPATRRLLDRLVRDGVLVRAPDPAQGREIFFHVEAVARARLALAPLLAPPGLLVKEAGAVLGISRKFSVPLLEYLDAVKFTRRVDQRRVLARQD